MKNFSLYNPNLPKYEWGSSWKSRAISEKQFAMIERLAGELNLTITCDMNILSRGTASMVIDQLVEAQRNGGAEGQYRNSYYNEIRHRTSKFTFEVA